MGFFKTLRQAIEDEGGVVVAKTVTKAAGSAFWKFTKTYVNLISYGVPLGIGIALGAAAALNIATKIALM